MIFSLLLPLLLGVAAGAAVAAAVVLTEQALRVRLTAYKQAETDAGYLIKQALDAGHVQYVAGVISADRTRRHREVIQESELSPELKAKLAGKKRIEFTL